MKSLLKNRVTINFLANSVAQIFNKILPLVTIAYAQSKLSNPYLGFALFAVALVELSNPFIEIGTGNYGQIEVGRNRDQRGAVETIIGNILAVKTINGILTFLGLLVVTQFFYSDYLLIVLSCSGMLVSSVLDMTYVQIGIQRVWALSVVSVISKVLALLAVVIFVRGPNDATAFALVLVSVNIITSLATAWLTMARFRPIVPSWGSVKATYTKVMPFTLTIVLLFAFERFDLFLVEKFATQEDLGLYAGASRVFFSLQGLIPALTLAFGAEMLSLKDDSKFSKQLAYSFGTVGLLVLPIAGGVWFVAEDLLKLIFDTSFVPVSTVFSILCVSLVPQMVFYTCGIVALLPRGGVKTVNIAMATGLIAGILFSVLASDDLASTALAVVVAKTVAASVVLVRARTFVSMLLLKLVGRIFAASVMMVAVLAYFQSFSPDQGLWADLAVAAVAFSVALLAFNGSHLISWLRRN